VVREVRRRRSPDYVHFDLDPGEGATFDQVRECALIVRDALEGLGMKPLVKTSGSKGLHVYVPIVRGPCRRTSGPSRRRSRGAGGAASGVDDIRVQVAKRPRGPVLVDYNQNAWGRTLASIYSVRPRPRASVSTPLTWDEVAAGAEIEDFRLDNVRERIVRVGDLWKPLLAARGRTDLAKFLTTTRRATRRRA
jgi:bifunctional non-homologous end joining protein LigD